MVNETAVAILGLKEIVIVNFLLILAALFLLIVLLFLIISTRNSIRHIKIALSRAEPDVTEEQPPTPEQPMVLGADVETKPEEQEEKEPIEEKPPEPEIFSCRKCGKDFKDKKKLQRHIGMAHYQDLEI